MQVKYISVMARHVEDSDTGEYLFGVMPEGYEGDGHDLPNDNDVCFWLEYDEELVVNGQYGDFIVEGVA